jgi:hypothetical protein
VLVTLEISNFSLIFTALFLFRPNGNDSANVVSCSTKSNLVSSTFFLLLAVDFGCLHLVPKMSLNFSFVEHYTQTGFSARTWKTKLMVLHETLSVWNDDCLKVVFCSIVKFQGQNPMLPLLNANILVHPLKVVFLKHLQLSILVVSDYLRYFFFLKVKYLLCCYCI